MNTKNRIPKMFFGSIFGMMITLVVVILTNFKPFPHNNILDSNWIVFMWLLFMYSVIAPVYLLPNSKWSKWWTK
jgi:hypothetical protein